MPLILAIEPDRRQASQLTAMVRGRLHAELVLGESAERALAALGQRVPDLILTSALLSPKDEAALGERLRSLDGGAAHVQTLTIPVLASSSSRASRAGGVLSALRRDKSKGAVASSDGCDPGVFAEQCKEYLERAATERATLEEHARTKALDAEHDAAVAATPASSVVRPSSGRESKKTKSDHQSIVRPAEPDEHAHSMFRTAPAETSGRMDKQPLAKPYEPPIIKPYGEPIVKTHDEPIIKTYEEPIVKTYEPIGNSYDDPIVKEYEAPAFAATDPYVASADDGTAGAHVEAPSPAPEPVVKRKEKKSSKKRQSGIRSVLGLGHDESDGPASLLAAVAALEAEEQVHAEPTVETIDPSVVDAAPIPEPPSIVLPAAPPAIFESSFIRPPAVESVPTLSAQLAEDARRAALPSEMPITEDILDLSSFLDRPARPSQTSTFTDEPVVEVYELDNSLLSTSFEDIIRPMTPSSEIFSTPAPATSAARTEGRSWPVLDTLITETSVFQAAPVATAPASTPVPEKAKPLGDILEALRRDAEQLPPAPPLEAIPEPFVSAPSSGLDVPAAPSVPVTTTSAAVPTTTAPPTTPATTAPPSASDAAGEDQSAADAKKKKRAKSSPAQDEWGFFDPDQCGFAALIEKLEEITDKDDPPSPRRA